MSIVAETATLAHGFTMAEIEKLTFRAFHLSSRFFIPDASERWEAAWFGIVEHLYSSEERPWPHELLEAGAAAAQAAARERGRHHGLRGEDRIGVNFEKYWVSVAGRRDDFTDKVAERLALPQVLGVLTDLEYEAISSLAMCDSLTEASAALGVEYKTLYRRVSMARKKIIAAWFSPETTPVRGSRKDKDVECRYGHARAEHSHKDPETRAWVCRTCKRNAERRRAARARS